MPKRTADNAGTLRSPLGGEQVRTCPEDSVRTVGGKLLTQLARRMRKTPTDAERILWRHLSGKKLAGYRFRRQHPIGGRYIADFVCLEQHLIIELDGSQHATSTLEYDTTRTAFLMQEGYHMLRFWNLDVVQDTDTVLETILNHLSTPHADSSAHSIRLDSSAPPQGGSVIPEKTYHA